jgi:hypothetical protein
MLVLETFPKLSIIGLIHEKFHKFMYKMRETFHGHFLSNYIFFWTLVKLNNWCSGTALASWFKCYRFPPILEYWRLFYSISLICPANLWKVSKYFWKKIFMNNFLLSDDITSAFPKPIGNFSWVLGQCMLFGGGHAIKLPNFFFSLMDLNYNNYFPAFSVRCIINDNDLVYNTLKTKSDCKQDSCRADVLPLEFDLG